MSSHNRYAAALLGSLFLAALPAWAAEMAVVSTSPVRNVQAEVSDSVSVTFDRPVNIATVNASTFRVFGKSSGKATGTIPFSNLNQTITLDPNDDFSAGEIVIVNLSHDIVAADTSPLRAAGYAFQFWAKTQPASFNFEEIDNISNRTPPLPGSQTRIYGANATDLNNDGYIDLTTVNEVSADLRVLMNRANGTGLYDIDLDLHPPVTVGFESSPNESGDFDNDGDVDIAVSSAAENSIWIALGLGNGNYATPQSITVHSESHGIAVLDVDGDADLDIVNANLGGDDLSLMINNGSGVFGAATFFDSGVDNGEYGLAAADMNNDGITDLVVGARDSNEMVIGLGNGNGTFTFQAAQSAGGAVWVGVVGDVNGDGNLDVATANDGSGNGAILLGNGDGTFDPPDTYTIGAHTASSDLGDLDGDGDLDWVLSAFGAGLWRIYQNDGSGNFTVVDDTIAPSNPSCAVLLDFDNDGALDMALTDEIADRVILMRNTGEPAPCSPAPLSCRQPFEAQRAFLSIVDKDNPATDRFIWRWKRGSATTKMEFDNPVSNLTDYTFCLYHEGNLVMGALAPHGGQCRNSPCWSDKPFGYLYKDPDRSPHGLLKMKLVAGDDGKAFILLRGKGSTLTMPDLSALTGTVEAQLQKPGLCWSATYSAPHTVVDSESFRDQAD